MSNARSLIIKAVQSMHDETCFSFDCKCHEKDWDGVIEAFVSEVAIVEGDRIIGELKEEAVREYRGLND